MNKRMSPVHYWLCRAILLLDRVRLPMKVTQYRPLPIRRYWMLVPVFGTNLLVKWDWFDLFYAEYTYRRALKKAKGSNG